MGRRLVRVCSSVRKKAKWVDDIGIDDALRSVTVEALEDATGNHAAWSLTAYAVCANR